MRWWTNGILKTNFYSQRLYFIVYWRKQVRDYKIWLSSLIHTHVVIYICLAKTDLWLVIFGQQGSCKPCENFLHKNQSWFTVIGILLHHIGNTLMMISYHSSF